MVSTHWCSLHPSPRASFLLSEHTEHFRTLALVTPAAQTTLPRALPRETPHTQVSVWTSPHRGPACLLLSHFSVHYHSILIISFTAIYHNLKLYFFVSLLTICLPLSPLCMSLQRPYLPGYCCSPGAWHMESIPLTPIQ